MYFAHAGHMSIGVHQVWLGLKSQFKPWFFDGSIVYWGGLYDTEAEAFAQAEIMKQTLR